MKNRSVRRFMAGFLCAAILCTGNGAASLAYAAALPEENMEMDSTEESAAEAQEAETEPAEEELTETPETEYSENSAGRGQNADENGSDASTEIASGTTENGITWDIKDGTLTVSGTGNVIKAGNNTPWKDCVDEIRSAQINVKNMTDASWLFEGCVNLETIDLSGLDTSQVTNMDCMFSGCSGLTSLDLRPLNTGNVTSMNSMFNGCSGLTSLNLSPLDTGNVTGMGQMFEGCSGLKNLDISPLKTSKVTSMRRMFMDCSGLTSLDLSKLNTEQVTEMENMFSGCSSLTSLDLSKLNTRNVTKMAHMFDGCSSLTSLDLSGVNTEGVADMGDMFKGCSSLASLDLSSFDTTNVASMSDMFSGCHSLASLDLSSWNTANVNYMSDMFEGCSSLTSLDLSPLNTANVIDMSGMFSYCSGLTSLDLSKLDTTNVTGMANMFGGCSGLTSLDLSPLDTAKVIDMSYMFDGCSSLESLDVSGLDTANVTGMVCMFSSCSSLTSLNISGLNTAKVTDMGSMFSFCSRLENLDVSSLNTAEVTNMSYMFSDCSSLESLDISSLDTGNVTDMDRMFSGCSRLTGLRAGSLNTAKVTRMMGMFEKCDNLVNLDFSPSDTTKVTDMRSMFDECISLTSLDLSDFNLESLEAAGNIFYFCNRLAQIEAPVNMKVSFLLPAGYGAWYNEDGNVVTELLNTQSHSVMVAKGKKPEVSYPRIKAVKMKTAYRCGETLDVSDLKVVYCESREAKEVVIDFTDFTTNEDKIDMSVPGEKELEIVYRDLKTTVTLTVSLGQYTVSFDLQGKGTDLPEYTGADYKDLAKGSLVKEPAGPSAEGYTFKGWYKDAACTEPWDFTADQIEGDLTLYACWEETGTAEATYVVTFELQGKGTTLPEYTGADYKDLAKGSLVKEPASPSAEGYTFKGWYKDAACTTLWDFATDQIEGNLTLYACWEETGTAEATYGVTFDLQGRGTTLPEYTGADYKDLAKGSLVKEPASPSAEGFIFKGWYRDAACITPWDFGKDIVENDLILYAKWLEVKGQVLPEDMEDMPEIPDEEDAEGILWAAYAKSVSYTGSAVKPAVRIYKNSDRLIEGLDYTVKYKYNTKACSADAEKAPTITVTFKGAYKEDCQKQTGKKSMDLAFSIMPVNLADVKANDMTAAKSKKSRKQVPELFWNGKKLAKNKDFMIDGENAYKDPGEYEIKLKAKGTNFTGEKTVKLTIVDTGADGAPKLMSKVKVGKIKSRAYTGEEVVLNDLKVTFKEKGVTNTLKEGTHYEVFYYENNTDAGTAAVILKGKEESGYIGTKRVTFKITAFDLKKDAKEAPGSQKLKGLDQIEEETLKNGAAKPRPQLTFNGKTLLEGKDYTISYKNNKKATTGSKRATIVIKGKGNFKGTINKTFTIKEAQAALWQGGTDPAAGIV